MFQQFSAICDLLSSRQAHSYNEAQTKSDIIEPILECFGWDPSQINEIAREWYPPSGKARDRIDYAFFPHDQPHLEVAEESIPVMLLEAKRIGTHLSNHTDQLSNYVMRLSGSRHEGMAALTNGTEWWFWSTIGRERLWERFAYKVHLVNDDPKVVYQILADFLRRDYWIRRVVEGTDWDATTWRIEPPATTIE